MFGKNGKKLQTTEQPRMRTTPRRVTKHQFTGAFADFSNYLRELNTLHLQPEVKIRDPFAHHPWVFAAAWVIATVAGQAPFTIFRETEETVRRRKLTARSHGYDWLGFRHGNHRKAMRRYQNPASKRLQLRKQLDPDFNHELNDVLSAPNPVQFGDQLWQTTFLWMAVRGELFWVLTDENNEFLTDGRVPSRIWTISPDFFEPIQETVDRGELIGWRMRVPAWMPQAVQHAELTVPLSSVVQFKFPNLQNLLRGQARISPALSAVLLDVKYHEHNRRILDNRGDPGGVISYDEVMSPDEEREFLEGWQQRHEGSENVNRTALLSGGFKYTRIGLAPHDMQGLEQQRWNRESILADMGVPPSVLGVTDFINYATQLGQDKNFWDKSVIPLLMLVETTLDGTLFFTQPDNVVGMFDLTDIEALRSGIMEKTEIAAKLSGQELHVPPRTAFETVGLEIEEYAGDEDVFVNPVLNTVEGQLESIAEPPEPPPESPPEPPPEPADDTEMRVARSNQKSPGCRMEGETVDECVDRKIPELIDEGMDRDQAVAVAHSLCETACGDKCKLSLSYAGSSLSLLRKRMVEYKISRWESFQRLQNPLENSFGKAYLRWVRTERDATLAIFDRETKALGLRGWNVIKQDEFLIQLPEQVLPDPTDTRNRLQFQTHPQYVASSEAVVIFTLEGDLNGIPTFSFDDALFDDIVTQRENLLLTKTPRTLRNALINQVATGIQNGETVRQVRNRIAGVYSGMASPAKTLQVARTETASLMNMTRDEMFKQQGFTEEDWSTANDEVVRADHVTFGNAGPQPRGFNYMDLVPGQFGMLEFPGDSRAPARQVVNCRCLKLPVK